MGGGPAVGDIRSRCLRLSDDSSEEARAVKRLLQHRLPAGDPIAAHREWGEIVEGRHKLWEGIGLPYRHTVRAFLVHFQVQILHHVTETFDLCNGSIGNFFFAGARMFFRSIDAAIFLYSRVSGIPEESQVLPAICTEDCVALGCALKNGEVIIGQNAISHPPPARSLTDSRSTTLVCKDVEEPLPSPIRRVFYTAAGRSGSRGVGFEELLPSANPAVLTAVACADAVVFGMGSFFSSLCPSLILEGVGEAIAALPSCAPRIFCLNGAADRETTGLTTAEDYVAAVSAALRRHGAPSLARGTHAAAGAGARDMTELPLSMLMTHVLVPTDCSLSVDAEALLALGIRRVIFVQSVPLKGGPGVAYDPSSFVDALRSIFQDRCTDVADEC